MHAGGDIVGHGVMLMVISREMRTYWHRFVFGVRPFMMRSDSELLIFIFRSEKKMGLHMQSNEKSDGIKSDLRIRWPKLSDFGPKSDDSTHRILKSKMASVFNQVKI